MMTLVGIILLILMASNAQGHSRELGVFALYNLPPFAIDLASPKIEAGMDVTPVVSDLQLVTEAYLKEFFRTSLQQIPTSLSQLHSLQLQISARMNGLDQIWAEMYGNAAFLEPEDGQARVSPADANDLFDTWITAAFDNKNMPYYSHILATVDNNPVLNTVSSLAVETNINAGPIPPIVIRQPDESSQDGWTKTETVLLSTLLLFVIGCGTGLFLYTRHDRRKYQRDKEFDRLQEHVCGTPPDNPCPRQSASSFSFAAIRALASGTPEESDVIPVVQETGARRYVSPKTPSEKFYGASYVHSERRSLERQLASGGSSKQQSVPPVGTGASPDHSETSSGMISWFHRMGVMRMPPLFDQDPKDQELPVVYRDFPRHDGTPCLMYNPKEKKKSPTTEAMMSPATNGSDNAGKSLSIEMGDAVFESTTKVARSPIIFDFQHGAASDESSEFLGRLENLYELKRRQYQNRLEMEEESKRLREQRRMLKVAQEEAVRTSGLTAASPMLSPPSFSATNTPGSLSSAVMLTAPSHSAYSAGDFGDLPPPICEPSSTPVIRATVEPSKALSFAAPPTPITPPTDEKTVYNMPTTPFAPPTDEKTKTPLSKYVTTPITPEDSSVQVKGVEKWGNLGDLAPVVSFETDTTASLSHDDEMLKGGIFA